MGNEFVSLGGYGVKDPIARAAVEELKEKTACDIQILQQNMSNAINVVQQNHNADMQELQESVSEQFGVMQTFVTPQMYGAKGDGVTDDTTAIQSAVNNGNHVLLPEGVYCISAPIILKDDTTFEGVSSKNCVITGVSGYNGNFIESENYDQLQNGTGVQPSNITIKNLTIRGNKNFTAAGDGISMFAMCPVIDSVIVEDVNGNGIVLDYNEALADMQNNQTMEGTFRNITVKNCGEHGILFNGPHDSYFDNIVVISPSQKAHNTYDCFYSENACFRMNHFHGWNMATWFSEKRARYAMNIANVADCFITNSHFEGASTANVKCVGNYNLSFVNCSFYAMHGRYNVLTGANGAIFTNCSFTGSSEYGGVACVEFIEGAWTPATVFSNCIVMGNLPFADELNATGRNYFLIQDKTGRTIDTIVINRKESTVELFGGELNSYAPRAKFTDVTFDGTLYGNRITGHSVDIDGEIKSQTANIDGNISGWNITANSKLFANGGIETTGYLKIPNFQYISGDATLDAGKTMTSIASVNPVTLTLPEIDYGCLFIILNKRGTQVTIGNVTSSEKLIFCYSTDAEWVIC